VPTPTPPPFALHHRTEHGRPWPFLVWRFDRPRRVISSAPVGGGIGERSWVLNAQVRSGYDRVDLDGHVDDLAAAVGLPTGTGVGLLTAADVSGAVPAVDGDVEVVATVGIRVPTWAAAPADRPDAVLVPGAAPVPAAPGTINIVALIPVPMSDAALVNLVATATEAKTQALLDAAIPGTGTATDAVCVVCPVVDHGAGPEPFGGPRSVWGARLARATYDSVRAGIGGSLRIIAGTADDGGPA